MKHDVEYMTICEYCGLPFFNESGSARFCGSVCRRHAQGRIKPWVTPEGVKKAQAELDKMKSKEKPKPRYTIDDYIAYTKTVEHPLSYGCWVLDLERKFNEHG